jgi:serine/threonine-protein kinase
LRINGARYLQKLEASDRVQYADLCYRIGNAYWFYYEHEESSQTAAVAWFEEAASLYQDMEGREAEYRRCNICSLIGNFYRKVIVSQTDGTDTDMYVEYWNNLLKLKSINDKSPDSEVITLRLYHEIVSRSMEYAGYLERDGISAGEIETVYDEIDMAIGELDKNASQKAHEEIEDIKSLMAQARRIVRSNGRG